MDRFNTGILWPSGTLTGSFVAGTEFFTGVESRILLALTLSSGVATTVELQVEWSPNGGVNWFPFDAQVYDTGGTFLVNDAVYQLESTALGGHTITLNLPNYTLCRISLKYTGGAAPDAIVQGEGRPFVKGGAGGAGGGGGSLPLHAITHENGGIDEISVLGLSGLLADGQTPLGHKTSHENGGSDEISVLGLSGLLADGQTPLGHETSHRSGGADSLDHGNLAGLSGDDHTIYVLVTGARAMTGTLTINPGAGNPCIIGAEVATSGTNVGIDFAYTLSGNFTSVRAMLEHSTITAQSFSYSIFEASPTMTTVGGGGGVFSFVTAFLFAPTINLGVGGALNNLTGFYYLPNIVAGTVGISYGIYIEDTAGAANTEIGGHFSGDEGALQVGTGAIGAGPTVNGRWFQDGDLVLGGSAMSGTEKLRVIGASLLAGALQHTGSTLGFFSTTPAVQPAAYTPTNVSTDRAYDANSTSIAELADVLGTLIADLQSLGIVQ